MMVASSSARASQVCRDANTRQVASTAAERPSRTRRAAASANAFGDVVTSTTSESSHREAGRSVDTTGTPAARYSSVLSGKLARLNAVSRYGVSPTAPLARRAFHLALGRDASGPVHPRVREQAVERHACGVRALAARTDDGEGNTALGDGEQRLHVEPVVELTDNHGAIAWTTRRLRGRAPVGEQPDPSSGATERLDEGRRDGQDNVGPADGSRDPVDHRVAVDPHQIGAGDEVVGGEEHGAGHRQAPASAHGSPTTATAAGKPSSRRARRTACA